MHVSQVRGWGQPPGLMNWVWRPRKAHKPLKTVAWYQSNCVIFTVTIYYIVGIHERFIHIFFRFQRKHESSAIWTTATKNSVHNPGPSQTILCFHFCFCVFVPFPIPTIFISFHWFNFLKNKYSEVIYSSPTCEACRLTVLYLDHKFSCYLRTVQGSNSQKLKINLSKT